MIEIFGWGVVILGAGGFSFIAAYIITKDLKKCFGD